MFVVALILAACACTILARTLIVADQSQRQAIESAASAFVAGIEMLQAEARLDARRKLNAVGYPTGRSGALQDDADCALIWREAVRDDAAPVAHFVADSKAGDRCEYALSGTAGSSARILYWPLGVDAKSVESSDGALRVARGVHVHVALGERLS